jgi:hypothetical protein
MCGLLADGNKATGFKSMVVAQFTGIGLQKTIMRLLSTIHEQEHMKITLFQEMKL